MSRHSMKRSPIVVTLVLIVSLLIFIWPAQVFAEDDEESVPEVSIKEMLVDDSEDDASEGNGTEMASEGEKNPESSPGVTWTIAESAFWGGVAGGLVGLGLYLVGGDRFEDGWIIAETTGGGLLVGAGIGVITVLTRGGSSSNHAHAPPSSVQWIQQDLPTTYQLRIIDIRH